VAFAPSGTPPRVGPDAFDSVASCSVRRKSVGSRGFGAPGAVCGARQGSLTDVGKGRSPWLDGRRAWSRLKSWHQGAPSAGPGQADDGKSALDALADVGQVRRLLDQAELVAVRTARRHGKSWAEIATRLGVTRQSAWERWRDLDEADSGPTPGRASDDVVPDVTAASAVDRAARALARSGEIGRAAMERRRRSSVIVPNVVGMSWDDARHALLDIGLVGVGPDPDGPPITALGWPDAVVTDQSPESGARVPAGSMVTLWIERGGGSGVREPRRPLPRPRTGRAMNDDPLDDAVGS